MLRLKQWRCYPELLDQTTSGLPYRTVVTRRLSRMIMIRPVMGVGHQACIAAIGSIKHQARQWWTCLPHATCNRQPRIWETNVLHLKGSKAAKWPSGVDLSNHISARHYFSMVLDCNEMPKMIDGWFVEARQFFPQSR